jgi:hypothetical protein
MRLRDGPYCAFQIVCKQLQLAARQREAARVIHCPAAVQENDDAVLAVQQLIDQLVNALGIGPELLPQRHVHVSLDSVWELIGSEGTERSRRSSVSIRVLRLNGQASLASSAWALAGAAVLGAGRVARVARERRNANSWARAP